jgi:hypothetical protein
MYKYHGAVANITEGSLRPEATFGGLKFVLRQWKQIPNFSSCVVCTLLGIRILFANSRTSEPNFVRIHLAGQYL